MFFYSLVGLLQTLLHNEKSEQTYCTYDMQEFTHKEIRNIAPHTNDINPFDSHLNYFKKKFKKSFPKNGHFFF